jgi:hypothetical protein
MLIFTNCRKYNPPEHDVVGMSRKLEEVFLDKISKVREDTSIFCEEYLLLLDPDPGFFL